MARRQCVMTAAEERLFLAVRRQALAVEKQTMLNTHEAPLRPAS
jgi:hypothetical protein